MVHLKFASEGYPSPIVEYESLAYHPCCTSRFHDTELAGRQLCWPCYLGMSPPKGSSIWN